MYFAHLIARVRTLELQKAELDAKRSMADKLMSMLLVC